MYNKPKPRRTSGKPVVIKAGNPGRPPVGEVVGNVVKASAHTFLAPKDRVCVVRRRDGRLEAYPTAAVVLS
jgi:hypothetical protein